MDRSTAVAPIYFKHSVPRPWNVLSNLVLFMLDVIVTGVTARVTRLGYIIPFCKDLMYFSCNEEYYVYMKLTHYMYEYPIQKAEALANLRTCYDGFAMKKLGQEYITSKYIPQAQLSVLHDTWQRKKFEIMRIGCLNKALVYEPFRLALVQSGSRSLRECTRRPDDWNYNGSNHLGLILEYVRTSTIQSTLRDNLTSHVASYESEYRLSRKSRKNISRRRNKVARLSACV
jgi:predicted NAD-dependent protein-ADP-ribosyltransferase YbiA (DUF1768 family)